MVVGADGPVVMLSARVCAYLNRYAGLEEFRREHRGADAEVDAALVAIRVLELQFRNSATGTKEAAKPELDASSKWLSTSETGNRLGITDRGVRTAIADGRLQAENVAGRWRINLEQLAHFKANRT
jgi:excisionase family DNA binding protein